MIALLGWSSLAWATPVLEDVHASFDASGSPGFLSFEGVTTDVTASADDQVVTFSVPAKSVSTGIALRDDHMWNTYIQVETFPMVHVRMNLADITWPSATAKKTSGVAAGVFELHGVSRPVEIAYELKGDATSMKVKASFPFDTVQHGVAIPTYVGVTIDSKMKATIRMNLTR